MGVFSNQANDLEQSAGAFDFTSDAMFDATWGEIRNTAFLGSEAEGITASEVYMYDPVVHRSMPEGLNFDKLQKSRPYTKAAEDRGVFHKSTRDLYEYYEPEITAAGGRPVSEIDEEVKKEILARRQASASASERSAGTVAPFSANLVGALQAGIKDPLTFMTLMAGLEYKGGSAVIFSLKEAGLQGTLGAAEGWLTWQMNKDWLEPIGIESQSAYKEVLETGGTQAIFAMVTSLAGSKLKGAKVDKIVNDLDAAIQSGDAAEIAKHTEIARGYLREGWQFDSAQEATINMGRTKQELFDVIQLSAGRTVEQKEKILTAASGAEDAANGIPGSSAKLAEADDIPSNIIAVEESPVLRTIDDIEADLNKSIERLEKQADDIEVNARTKYEKDMAAAEKMRDGELKDKRMMEIEDRLKKSEAEAVKARKEKAKQADAVKKSFEGVDAARDAVKKAENLERSMEIKARQLEQEADRVFKAARKKRDKDMARADRMRDGATKQKFVKRVEADFNAEKARYSKLKDASAKAKARAEKAKAAKPKAYEALDRATKELNEMYNTKEGIAKLNESASGFKYKQRKVEKGEKKKAAPAKDTPSADGAETPKKPDRVEPEDGTPSEEMERATKSDVDEILERTDAEPGSEADKIRKEVLALRGDKLGMKQAAACFFGE